VRSLATFNNKLIAGGEFTAAGLDYSSIIASWDGTSWSHVGSGFNGPGTPRVVALATYGTDLIAAGEFTSSGGSPVPNIGRWDGVSWTALGGGFAQGVQGLAVVGTNLYAVGSMTTALDHNTSVGNVARWDGVKWNSVNGTVSGGLYQVICCASLGGELYVGGGFDSIGGVAARSVAKWTGSAWVPLGAGLNGTVDCMTVHNGQICAGGYFLTSGGQPDSMIATWNGSSWVQVGRAMDAQVYSLASVGGKLYAGGVFSRAASTPLQEIAVWDGASWGPLGSGLTYGYFGATAMASYDSGLFVGGDFGLAGGKYSRNIARWQLAGAVDVPPARPEGQFALSPPWPNPTRAGATMSFELPAQMNVNLEVCDIQGRRIAVIARGSQTAGTHSARWDGLNQEGKPVGGGIYFARLAAGGREEVKKIVLVR
jgi:hypothetical protein